MNRPVSHSVSARRAFLRFVVPLVTLAFLAPSSAFAQGKGKGDTASGAVVIPGGSYAETYVISAPGSYVLGGNREMTDATKHIIEVAAPDVTLDLGGFAILFTATSGVTGNGIHIPATENIAIRDGSISNANFNVRAVTGKGLTLSKLRSYGGAYGLYSTVTNSKIEDCLVHDTTSIGVYVSNGSIVRNCQVSVTTGRGIQAESSHVDQCQISGGTTGVYLGTFSTLTNSRISEATTWGVWMNQSGVVRNCHMVRNRGAGIGVGGVGNLIVDNVINITLLEGSIQVGVYVNFSGSAVLAGNRMGNNGTNVVGSYIDGGHNFMTW